MLISYRDENVIQKSKNYRIIIKNCSHKFKISTNDNSTTSLKFEYYLKIIRQL